MKEKKTATNSEYLGFALITLAIGFGLGILVVWLGWNTMLCGGVMVLLLIVGLALHQKP